MSDSAAWSQGAKPVRQVGRQQAPGPGPSLRELAMFKTLTMLAAALTFSASAALGAQSAGSTAASAGAVQSQPQPAQSYARATGAQLHAISATTDPSAATRAYTAAVKVAPRDYRVYQRYVKNMIDLRAVGELEAPATMLTQLHPSTGVGWAVLAYFNARRGEMTKAVANETRAMNNNPSSPFALQIAGQLVAWYSHADKSKLSAELADQIARLKAYRDHPAYKIGYRTTDGKYALGQQPGQLAFAEPFYEQPSYSPPAIRHHGQSFYYPYSSEGYSFRRYYNPYLYPPVSPYAGYGYGYGYYGYGYPRSYFPYTAPHFYVRIHNY